MNSPRFLFLLFPLREKSRRWSKNVDSVQKMRKSHPELLVIQGDGKNGEIERKEIEKAKIRDEMLADDGELVYKRLAGKCLAA